MIFDGGREKIHRNCNAYLQILPLSQNSVLTAPLTSGAFLNSPINQKRLSPRSMLLKEVTLVQASL